MVSEARKASLLAYYYKNKEKLLDYQHTYYRENREHLIDCGKKYKDGNRGKYNAYEAKRRAAKRDATPVWADLNAIQEIYIKASKLGKQIDHIIPLSSPTVCGLHWEGNLQLLSPTENLRKSNTY